MHYIIQENVFKEQNYDLLLKTIDKLKLDYTIVRIFPFVDKIVDVKTIPEHNYNVDDLIDFEPPTKNVFVFGAIKLARVASSKGWNPGSMMNDNHDFMVYREHYKNNLLNYDSEILKISENIKWNNDVKFIRPTKDTKSFTGNTFTQKEWKEAIEHYLHNYRSESFNENTEIQVSTPKKIQKEIRFWVVNGKVITGSQYRLGNSTIYDSLYDDEAFEFAQKMVDKYKLADAFVIDVCLHNDEWKIVECGCINCAGFYKSDIQKMIMEVDNFFNIKC